MAFSAVTSIFELEHIKRWEWSAKVTDSVRFSRTRGAGTAPDRCDWDDDCCIYTDSRLDLSIL